MMFEAPPSASAICFRSIEVVILPPANANGPKSRREKDNAEILFMRILTPCRKPATHLVCCCLYHLAYAKARPKERLRRSFALFVMMAGLGRGYCSTRIRPPPGIPLLPTERIPQFNLHSERRERTQGEVDAAGTMGYRNFRWERVGSDSIKFAGKCFRFLFHLKLMARKLGDGARSKASPPGDQHPPEVWKNPGKLILRPNLLVIARFSKI